MRLFHSGFGVIFLLVLVAILFLGGGAYIFVAQQDNDTTMEEDTMMEEDATMKVPAPGNEGADEMMEGGDSMMEDTTTQSPFTGILLAGSKAPLLDFTKSDYDKALASKKIVVLYFYANWCPICKAEFPKAQAAFDELNDPDVVGFRVNFNDNETDQHEKDLAREFGVAYQHTKVILKNGERVLKSPESWEKSRYLSEINALIVN